MGSLQKLTKQSGSVESELTDWRHEALVDYRACGGLITDDDGIKKLTVDDFASQLNVTRQTLYDWQKLIPNFWDKVNKRRGEVGTKHRLSRIHEVMYLSAMKPGKEGFQDRKLWLEVFDPAVRSVTRKLEVEHDVSDRWSDMARLRLSNDQAIEGEVVDVKEKT